MFNIKYDTRDKTLKIYKHKGNFGDGNDGYIASLIGVTSWQYRHILIQNFHAYELIKDDEYGGKSEIVFENKKDAESALDYLIGMQTVAALTQNPIYPNDIEYIKGAKNVADLKLRIGREGQIAYVEDEKSCYMYLNGDWVTISSK